jgi:hypothetical protein
VPKGKRGDRFSIILELVRKRYIGIKYYLSPSVDLVCVLVQGVIKLPDHLFHLVEDDQKAHVQAVFDALSTDCLENRL